MKKQLAAVLAAVTLMSAQALPFADSVNQTLFDTAVTASAVDAPAKVTGVKAGGITETSAVLSWKKVTNAKGYRIYKYNAKTKKYEKITTLSKNTTVKYTLDGLKPDSEYKLKVRAYSKVNGKTVWGTSSAAVTVKTLSYEPAKVMGVKAAATSESSGKLSWTKVKNAKGYRVYLYNAAAKKYEKIATISSNTASYSLKGLKANTSYKYKVRAYRKVGGTTYWGTSSAAVTLKTPAHYDEQMAKALREKGEEEFYSIVEYAEMYHVRVENISIIRETDTQFGIRGLLIDPAGFYDECWIICKCEFKNGQINAKWFEIGRGQSPNDYDRYTTEVSKDDVLHAIYMVGYLDE